MFTHEQFIHAVARAAIMRLPEAERAAFDHVKLAYGAGAPGLRGVTYYDRWGKPDAKAPFVEVCAFGQESHIQLAGTTIHELAHVLAGWGAAHGKEWKDACARLGLRAARAAGHRYMMAGFAPDIRDTIARLPVPDDGAPVAWLYGAPGTATPKPKPCGAGIGTKGGKSRGTGSGSRLRKFVCDCEPPVIVRASRDELDATCNCCTGLFKRA